MVHAKQRQTMWENLMFLSILFGISGLTANFPIDLFKISTLKTCFEIDRRKQTQKLNKSHSIKSTQNQNYFWM